MAHRILPALPVDALLDDVLGALRTSPNLVLEAPPGTGKTTRVPPALLGLGGHVLVLEPRRIAARMAARRVAAEMGEAVGETVGYQVRFDEVSGPRTRLRFLTEGVLVRRLLNDGNLNGVAAVCLDEFHERHLDGDLAMALLRRLQRTRRPDLKLVAMSATLASSSVASFLGGCPILRSEGRPFDLAVEYRPYSAAPLERQVLEPVERLTEAGTSGDVLVFLPGAAEIAQCARAVESLARSRGIDVLPLHGSLPAGEQDRAVAPSARRKLILSTNVAESSITVEGVRAVIDSGLARFAGDSPWTGLPTLTIGKIAQASATQRAGRAGRTGPGRVVRLYTAGDLRRRPQEETPEILRRELSQLVLNLHAAGVSDPRALDWLDAPPEAALAAAEELLLDLNAFSKAQRVRRAPPDSIRSGSRRTPSCAGYLQEARLTPLGRAMTRYPLHPRLGRLVVEGVNRGAGREACLAAAWLSSGARCPSPDFLAALETDAPFEVRTIARQLERVARPEASSGEDEDGLAQALLRAFPDRVARTKPSGQLALCNGDHARFAGANPPEFLLALDVESRAGAAQPLVRLFCPIRPDWLLEGCQAVESVVWNARAERVEARGALVYRQLAIEETDSGAPDPERAETLLAEYALQAGLGRFTDEVALRELLARTAFAAAHGPIRRLEPTDAEACLRELCRGCRGFAQLREACAGFLSLLETKAGNPVLLEERAPSRLRLPNGRAARIHYEPDQPPWAASRMQDFFGLAATPRIGRGSTPLTLKLLAPNQRPVQTTSDLAGFWERLYPSLRRELSRRYPKHRWPEKPA